MEPKSVHLMVSAMLSEAQGCCRGLVNWCVSGVQHSTHVYLSMPRDDEQYHGCDCYCPLLTDTVVTY